jgi:hypothetical protein
MAWLASRRIFVSFSSSFTSVMSHDVHVGVSLTVSVWVWMCTCKRRSQALFLKCGYMWICVCINGRDSGNEETQLERRKRNSTIHFTDTPSANASPVIYIINIHHKHNSLNIPLLLNFLLNFLVVFFLDHLALRLASIMPRAIINRPHDRLASLGQLTL